MSSIRTRLLPAKTQRSRGQSMVEFALVAPLLFLMLALMVDFGRLVYIYSAISNAAKEGARTLSLVPQANSDCASLDRTLKVAQGFTLKPDPNSLAGNQDANLVPADPLLGPSAPGPGKGYVYIWPAVSRALPQQTSPNCVGDPANPNAQRPLPPPGPTRDVEVQITYHFTPLTPIVSGFINDFNIRTLSVTRTEY